MFLVSRDGVSHDDVPSQAESMMQRLAIALLVLAACVAATPAAAANDTLTPDQKRAVEEVIRDYLVENPEILDEAMESLRRKREAAVERQRADALAAVREELETDPSAPVAGNPDGDVTIVEFFDYQCGYCKQVFPAIAELLKSDGKVRYVFREFPILGASSVFAARAALAAWHVDPDKYMAFHTALMGSRGTLTDATVLTAAAESGFDAKALTAAMADPRIDAAINRNYELAETLTLTGTPAFVVGKYVVPGAVDLDFLRKLLADVRKEKE
jgi:protein-disulfide isomerase